MPPLTRQPGTPWRSLEELAGTPEFRQLLENEFPAGAAWLSEVEAGQSSITRRRFVQLMGASFALAGLTNCGRPPRAKIVPYVRQPEDAQPGQAVYYATALPFRSHARGVLVASHLGRPTKIEGNPDHPSSLGATDAAGQAAVLDLYDPDRARTVRYKGMIATWDAFADAHRRRRGQHAEKRGHGYAILIEPTSSPTLQRLLAELLGELPEARIYQHAAIAPTPPALRVDFSVPELIVAADDDFLADHPDSLRYTRQFVARRRAGSKFNRLYVIEPTPTLTGAMADHRLAVKPSRISAICRAARGETVRLNPHETEFVRCLREDLKTFAGRVLVRGAAAGILLEHAPGGDRVPPTLSGFPGLDALAADLTDGRIQTLLILGGNPVYAAPGSVPFAAALKHAECAAHLAAYEDETSALCQWHLPAAHLLESWGDIRAYDGTPCIQQPLIEPLYQGRTALELLAPDKDAREVIRDTWRSAAGASDDFDTFWQTTLHDGWADPRICQFTSNIPMLESASAAVPVSADDHGMELVIRPDPNVGGGEQSNNGWLQELPRPFTKLVWDNAALISPALAKRHNLSNGDVVKLNPFGVRIPVWILPGQADDTITVHLGYGRRAAGSLGNNVGVDIYPLVGRAAVTIEPTGEHHELVSTQHHSLMEGRELIWQLTAKEVAEGNYQDRPPEPHEVTLYPGNDEQLNGRYAWAMSVDLSACIGCNACVVACQAENNSPVVGKREVARGREMHWLRIDRYFTGEDPEQPGILHQPVACHHCEKAPCEVVCPVEATVHTADGLNAMVYNRCVGTRYCSNNCPYKVRRFNFFDFRREGGKSDPRSLQANPEVTVRGRGVMEKCTYCVQRIQNAVIAADRENRRVADGEIVTACQQVCPAQAIVFGDLRTVGSKVAELRGKPESYALLGELNTRPRTNYLAKTTNPHESA